MSNKVYTNFEAINKDLKVLRLRRQIKEEELKLRFKSKEDESTLDKLGISPTSSILSFLGSVVQKALVTKLVSKVMGYPRVNKKHIKD